MAKQTFTSGQVLTAAEMNSLQENDYNWTVTTKTASYTLAAGDEGTRIVMNNAGATTITVDDAVFAAGDVVWIHNIGAGTCTITAGTATVSSLGELALEQYAGGHLYFTSASAAIFFPTEQGGGGKILQVVQATYATAESTTSDTYVDTSLDLSITPSAATSKVLIICNVCWKTERTAVSSGYVYHAIERGGSQIWEQVGGSYYDSSSSVPTRNLVGNSTLTYLDSPSTTSATTYTLQHKKGPSGQPVTGTSFFDDIPGSLILMEVSA